MDSIQVHRKDALKLLLDLKIHKATGPDEVPAFILKSAASQFAPILTRLYQYSLNTVEVPTDWKNAHIVLVFKKGEKHLPSDYRPVSLTSIVCKVLKHIVHSSVMNHFDRHNILTDNQHGFRAKRSCESQLITTIQKIASKWMSFSWISQRCLIRSLINAFCISWTTMWCATLHCVG